MATFKLSKNFVKKYQNKKPPFGFNGLGEIVYYRTYSRTKDDGTNEHWYETIERVVNGTYRLQQRHIEANGLEWNPWKAQKSAQEMYDRMFNMKFLPPGRGLWAMGSGLTEDKQLYAALNNCGFVSTEKINENKTRPFTFLMDACMLGVGVGFDTKGTGKIIIKGLDKSKPKEKFIIPDTREGWVSSLEKLLLSHFDFLAEMEFDYSQIRKEGLPIKGFGGKSSGPKPLMDLHKVISNILEEEKEQPISAKTIVDIMNLIGRCVVAGNVRRTAEISFGDPNSDEYLDLKNSEVYPDRNHFETGWGWTSNNSIFAEVGMDYTNVATRTSINGEPGYAWLDNMKKYSRMCDPIDNKDHRASGGNPCQPSWAKVLTKDGIRTFADIQAGDEIWSVEGWTKILKKWSTGVKNVYKYKTSAGIFYGTENHRVVSNSEKVEVRNAESIDIISGSYNDNYIINPQDVMDGLVLGDGFVHQASNNKVFLLIGENDQDYFSSEISECIVKERPGVCSRAYEIKTTISSDELLKTYERKIPKRFVEDKNKLVGFLRGLYSANGSVCGDRVTLKATSLDIVETVQLMLNSIGIMSYITTNRPSKVKFSNGEYLCKQSYDLNITTGRMKFKNLIGFIQEYKNEKIRELSVGRRKSTYDIQSVEFVSEEEVFDITVDNSSHTYWTQGCNVSNCLEQTLESDELCCLVENFIAKHDSLEDFIRTLKFSYLYAKTVTLGKTHWPETNRVMLRNRRIGSSLSGIQQFVTDKGLETLRQWLCEGYKAIEKYDEEYSDWLAIPKSIKKTSIKPSGSVSKVAGTTSGMHWPVSNYLIKNMRIAKNSDLVPALKKAGYKIEPMINDPENTLVVSIPYMVDSRIRPTKTVSMWEQLAMAAFLQKYWADNQVSCTVEFQPHEKDQIKHALNYYQYQLKGVSLLPYYEQGAFPQMPEQVITKEEYEKAVKNLKPLTIDTVRNEEVEVEKYCTTDKCELK